MNPTSITINTDSGNLPSLNHSAETLTTWANGLIIISEADFEAAAPRLAQIKNGLKLVEEDKENLYRPAKTTLDAISAKYKPLLDMLTSAEKTVRTKMATFAAIKQEEERKRLAEEQEARRQTALREAAEREAAIAEQKRQIADDAAARAAELKEAGDAASAVAVQEQAKQNAIALDNSHNQATEAQFAVADRKIEVTKTASIGGAGQFTTRMVTKHRLLDISKVPPRYLVLNDVEVRKAISEGATAIPGIEFYQEPVGSMRSAA